MGLSPVAAALPSWLIGMGNAGYFGYCLGLGVSARCEHILPLAR